MHIQSASLCTRELERLIEAGARKQPESTPEPADKSPEFPPWHLSQRSAQRLILLYVQCRECAIFSIDPCHEEEENLRRMLKKIASCMQINRFLLLAKMDGSLPLENLTQHWVR